MKILFRTPMRFAAGAAASGILLGLSTPLSIHWTLGPLAWFWVVPLLVALGSRTPAWKFFPTAWAATIVTALISTWGVGQAAGHRWAVVYFAYAGLALALPFVPFLLIRTLAGWEAALWSMPLVWPLTEWLLRHVEGTPTWLTIAVTQANSTWTNQFADLFGEWGLTAWVMLFNVLLYKAWSAPGAPRRFLKPVAAMLVPALLYSGAQYGIEKRRVANAPASQHLSVLLVQPDTDFHTATDPYMKRAIETAIQLTDEEVLRAKPDLIVWPEGAIPLTLRTNPGYRQVLNQAIADWGTPLITGTFDTSIGLRHAPIRPATNAAVLLTPGPPGSGPERVHFGPVHAKSHLMPFVEMMPYQHTTPKHQRTMKTVSLPRTSRVKFEPQIPAGTGLPLQPGFDRQVLRWRADQGWLVSAAAPICFEELFASDFADYARRGAEFFTVLSDDSSFGKAASGHTLAAIGRLRAIETHRPVLRSTITGLTTAFDAAGREIATASWWGPATVRASITGNDRISFYSSHPDAFPLFCAAGMLPLAIFLGRKRNKK